MQFDTRALEFHSGANIWNPQRILAALQYMTERSLNTLVLNEVGIVDALVLPGGIYSGEAVGPGIHARYAHTFRQLYRHDPRGRGIKYNNVEFVRWVVRRAAERGIAVYLNNKEIAYADAVAELHPEVYERPGIPCPTHPYWMEFLRVKYTELWADLPGLAGLITSPATGESRLSISANRCDCARCRATSPADWYRDVLLAIHGATARAGKRLVVRDFVFDRNAQDDLARAWADLPADIVLCLKNTPHDYYPTFPDNPRIGELADREQWVEFDSMGQYYGWGVAPAILIDDTRDRLHHAAESGVRGVLSRTDWEALHTHSAFETPQLINLDAMALLAIDPAADDDAVYARWLDDRGAVPAGTSEQQQRELLAWVGATLGRTWEVVRRLLYAHDCVFSDSSLYPVSVEHAFWLGEEKNSLREWDPSKHDALAPTADNVRSLIAEKDEGMALYGELFGLVVQGNPGFTEDFYRDLVGRFEIFGRYVEGFRLAMRSAAVARHVGHAGDAADPALVAALPGYQRELEAHCDLLEQYAIGDEFPAFLLLNGSRLRVLHDDVQAVVTAAGVLR